MARTGTERWPTAGLGLVAGAAVTVTAAPLLDWPVGIAVAVGAGLGLVAGAVVAVLRRPGSRS